MTESYSKRLRDLDPEQVELIESLTRGVVAKLLHEPSVRLRNQAGTPQGEMRDDSLDTPLD